MTYAAELLDRTMQETGLSQAALAKRLDVAPPQLSKWRHGTNPIPEDKLEGLFDLGNLNEAAREYFALGAMRDTVTTTGVMRALDAVLNRLRPAVATVGLLALCAIAVPVKAAESVGYGLALPVNAYYVQLRRWLARRLRPTARSRRFDGRSGFLSCPTL